MHKKLSDTLYVPIKYLLYGSTGKESIKPLPVLYIGLIPIQIVLVYLVFAGQTSLAWKGWFYNLDFCQPYCQEELGKGSTGLVFKFQI